MRILNANLNCAIASTSVTDFNLDTKYFVPPAFLKVWVQYYGTGSIKSKQQLSSFLFHDAASDNSTNSR